MCDNDDDDQDGAGLHSLLSTPDVQCSTVTALTYAGELLIVGEGNLIKIERRSQTKRSCSVQCPIFTAQAVHGLTVLATVKDGYVVLAWGGTQLCVLIVKDLPSDSQPSIICKSRMNAPDWVLSCKSNPHESIISETTSVDVAVVTAHNALMILQVDVNATVDQLSSKLFTLSASSRVLLYAAAIKWASPLVLLVAAGSALGDIIVWSCALREDNGGKKHSVRRSAVHYTYPAHDGSIFGLDMGSVRDEREGHPDKLILASCSDDRTIRIWDISAAQDDMNDSLDSHAHAEALDEFSTSDKSADCLVQAWGHTSRIWQVAFLNDPFQQKPSPQLMSFGEDATHQLWSLKPADVHDPTWRLTNDEHFLGHTGKNIWSHAFSYDTEVVTVATGGADGVVTVIKLSRDTFGVEANRNSIQQWSQNDIAKVVLQSDGASSGEITRKSNSATMSPKAYSFVSGTQLLMTTPGGHVLFGEFTSEPSTKGEPSHDTSLSWDCLATIPSLRSYSITAGLPELGVGFVAGSTGDVYAFSEGKFDQSPLVKVPGKVGGVYTHHMPSAGGDQSGGKVALLVSLVALPKVYLFQLDQAHMRGLEQQPAPLELDLPSDLTISSMHLQEFGDAQPLLFIGARSGHIACYQLRDIPQLISYTSHHGDAVTAIHWTSSEPASNEDQYASGYLLSSARDSSYSIHHYDGNGSKPPQIVHRTALPIGPNIEGFYFTEESEPHLIFYGFRSKDFVVYDETDHAEIMRVECGGAHRIWSFQPTSAPEARSVGTFCWTRASVLCMSKDDRVQTSRAKKGGHGREIKAVAVRPPPNGSGKFGSIIATGAEDTDIRFFTLDDKTNASLKCISIVKKHNTGLQQLKWSSDGRYLFSCGGSEEFFVWRIREVPFVQVGIVVESALPLASELPDLRVMAFDVLDTKSEHAETGDHDASFTISIVLSDSTLRVYAYTSTAQGPAWQLLCDGRYTTCCLTQILHLRTDADKLSLQDPFPIITAGTDGSISFWTLDISSPVATRADSIAQSPARPLQSIKIHQNAIICAQLVPCGHPSPGAELQDYLLITGGDDNALAITRFSSWSQSSSPQITHTSTLLIPRAHAAAVRAIALRSRSVVGSRLELEIVTASNDQRLKTWHVRFDARRNGVEGLSVVKRGNVYTAVADIAGVDVIGDVRDGLKRDEAQSDSEGERRSGGDGNGKGLRVVVCGVGMDVRG